VADTETTESQEDTETTADQNGDTPDQPDDPGRSEVDQATEKHLKDLRSENASWRKKLRAAEKEIEGLKTSSATEIEQAVAKARQETLTEATAQANSRIVKAEVMAAAAGKLRDPGDAAVHLDLTNFEVDDNGDVDRKALVEAIDELVKTKPYLAGTRDPDFGRKTPESGTGKSMNDLIKQRLRNR